MSNEMPGVLLLDHSKSPSKMSVDVKVVIAAIFALFISLGILKYESYIAHAKAETIARDLCEVIVYITATEQLDQDGYRGNANVYFPLRRMADGASIVVTSSNVPKKNIEFTIKLKPPKSKAVQGDLDKILKRIGVVDVKNGSVTITVMPSGRLNYLSQAQEAGFWSPKYHGQG